MEKMIEADGPVYTSRAGKAAPTNVVRAAEPVISEIKRILKKYGRGKLDVYLDVTSNTRNSFLEYQGGGRRDWRYVGPGCINVTGYVKLPRGACPDDDAAVELEDAVWAELLKIPGPRFVDTLAEHVGTDDYNMLRVTAVLPRLKESLRPMLPLRRKRVEAARKLAASSNLKEFYRDLKAAVDSVAGFAYDSFAEFNDDLESIEQAILFNVASDDEYGEWTADHNGDADGYTDHYFEVADELTAEINAALKGKWTGYSIDSDSDDIQVFVYITVD